MDAYLLSLKYFTTPQLEGYILGHIHTFPIFILNCLNILLNNKAKYLSVPAGQLSRWQQA